MFDALSFAEIDGQHVEVLPTRTVLSLLSAGGHGGSSHGDGSHGDGNQGYGGDEGEGGTGGIGGRGGAGIGGIGANF